MGNNLGSDFLGVSLEGEVFWNYSAVKTNFAPEDEWIARRLSASSAGFEETIWGLYDRKQAMERRRCPTTPRSERSC